MTGVAVNGHTEVPSSVGWLDSGLASVHSAEGDNVGSCTLIGFELVGMKVAGLLVGAAVEVGTGAAGWFKDVPSEGAAIDGNPATRLVPVGVAVEGHGISRPCVVWLSSVGKAVDGVSPGSFGAVGIASKSDDTYVVEPCLEGLAIEEG